MARASARKRPKPPVPGGRLAAPIDTRCERRDAVGPSRCLHIIARWRFANVPSNASSRERDQNALNRSGAARARDENRWTMIEASTRSPRPVETARSRQRTER